MISRSLYIRIEKKHGRVGSWAIWSKVGDKPKSNMSNMDVFDEKINPALYETVNTNVVMVGLNFSREVEFNKPFSNFHDHSPYANDFKIRFAFEGTPFYGAYMTDVIKNFPMLKSKDVIEFLKKNPDALKANINGFKDELKFICSGNTTILAFGSDTYNFLKQGLDKNDYQHLIKITHYSHQISKEDYRKKTHEQIYDSTGIIPSSTDFISQIDKKISSYSKLLSNLPALKADKEKQNLLNLKSTLKNFESIINRLAKA